MNLSEWRNEIDAIDGEVLELLKRRAAIVAEIGKRKAAAGLPVVDEQREREILSRVSVVSDSALSAESAACVFRCIIEESRRIQTAIIGNGATYDTKNSDSGRARLVCGRRGAGVF